MSLQTTHERKHTWRDWSTCTTLKINNALSISDMFPNTLKFNAACSGLFYFKHDFVIGAADIIGSLYVYYCVITFLCIYSIKYYQQATYYWQQFYSNER